MSSENKTIDNIKLRSTEVRDILTKIPNWMIRWGSTLFLLLILLILFISWLIKYPDLITTETIITTTIPPEKKYAKTTGKLDSIYIEDLQKVEKKTVLAVIKNSANSDDVFYLKAILDLIDISNKSIKFPINEIPILILGDIELAYANFENNYTEYELNILLNPFNNEGIAKKTSLNELKIRLQNMQSQYSSNRIELDLKQKDLNRNRELLNKGVISELDFEKIQIEFLSAERNLKNLSASISQNREAIANANKEFRGNNITRTREEARLLRSTIQSFNQLHKAILDWEDLYVFKSDTDGKVSFLNYWSSNQTVEQGDLVFTIIPEDNIEYVAKVKAAAQNSGKIKIGQVVNIKLQNYPEIEFGMLKGVVSSISLTPDKEGNYLIDVALPKKLISTYKKEIKFNQEMIGIAEIITEDLSLLDRFIYQIKSLLDN